MTTNKYIVTGIIVAVVLGIAAVFGFRISLPSSPQLGGALNNQYIEQYIAPIKYNGGYNSQLPIQTSSTLDVTGATTLNTLTVSGTVSQSGPMTFSSVNSTTTPVSLTLQPGDLNYATILMTPTVGSITVTLPATSTLTTFLPITGQRQTRCSATQPPRLPLYSLSQGTPV